MAKYLITHWVTADFIAEKVVDESEIDQARNDLKGNTIPNGSFSFVMLKGTERTIRTTYELYDEKLNISSKDRTSDK
jgi:hypothetical protein|tara:strand:- start:225 stop:455 length:231 start_codon:yes stop_codon:yes gene_type:complete